MKYSLLFSCQIDNDFILLIFPFPKSHVQTGGDGCICYFEYDGERQTLKFMGLKQLKELSLVQSVCHGVHFSKDQPNNEYAAGFASTDFILWNLTAETKVHPGLLILITF